MKNISCCSCRSHLRARSLVTVWSGTTVHTSPSWLFSFFLSFCCCLLSSNFPRKTPHRYMPCSAAGRLWSQGLAITQSRQLHKHRSFHNVFSSAGPLLMKKQNKTRAQDFSKAASCLLLRQLGKINRGWGVEGGGRGGISFLEARNTRLALFFLNHPLPRCTHARAHTHTYTQNSPSELLPTVPGWDIPHIKELLPEMTAIPKSASNTPLQRTLQDMCRSTLWGMCFSNPSVFIPVGFQNSQDFFFLLNQGQINASYVTVANQILLASKMSFILF